MRLFALLLLLWTPRLALAAGPLPNIDLSGLADSDKAAYLRLVEKEPSACGKAHSLETSLKTDPKCRRSVYAARYLLKLFQVGLLPSEAEEQYAKRFGPDVYKYKDIPVADAPLRGDPGAPVTLVDFSDFQCPHCKHVAPILERLVDENAQVKLYFKNFPLGAVHPESKYSAQAAVAAGKQGKFWQFHDKLFGGDQNKQSPAELERHARDLKLDVAKWKKDTEAAAPKVERDRADGEKVNIASTPTVFINGRRFYGPLTYEALKDWIDEELNK